jgi:hypothetical protein
MIGIVPALAAAAASSLLAAPQASPPTLQGVWQGAIGALPVRACLIQQHWGTFGVYYYLSRRKLIPLTRDSDGGPFDEPERKGVQGGKWTIDTVAPRSLTGRWTRAGRTLPIRLTRVAGVPADEPPCMSMTFNRPRLAGIGAVARRAAKDGTPYTRLILDHRGRFERDVKVESFRLDGGGAAARRINARLHEPLDGDPPDWFDCIRGGLDTHGAEGNIDDVTRPTLITARWLSAVREDDSYCGGPHPNEERTMLTFDRATGRQVDLYTWLGGKALRPVRFGSELRPEFRSFLLARWKPKEAECGPVLREAKYWAVALARTALVFRPGLVRPLQGCAEDIPITFPRLRPYLSAEGLKMVKALEAERARRRR